MSGGSFVRCERSPLSTRQEVGSEFTLSSPLYIQAESLFSTAK